MKSKKSAEQDANLVFSLLAASAKIERTFNWNLSNVLGISYTEYFLLRQLSHVYKGSANRVDLASAVNLTPSAVTRALKPLEKMGVIETIKSDRDARSSIASLTDVGVELLKNAQGIVRDEIAALELEPTKTAEFVEWLEQLGGSVQRRPGQK